MGKKIKKLMEDFEPCFREMFMEWLDDKEVQEKLFNLFEKKDSKENLQEIERLKAENRKCKDEIIRLENNLDYYKTESEKAVIRLTKEKEELYEELNAEKSKPKYDGKIAEAYAEYCELPQNIREKYSNMLGNGTVEEFILKGTKYALELYERICMDWSRLDGQTLESMNKIFDCIFEQFCVINSGYRRLCVEVGEPFDMSLHTRTAESSPSGVVREVILCGYEKNNGVKVKSLVKVG